MNRAREKSLLEKFPGTTMPVLGDFSMSEGTADL